MQLNNLASPERIEVDAPASTSTSSLDAHRLLVMWLFIATGAVSSLFVVFMLYFERTGRGASLLLVVLPTGALGGFVSSLRRLYRFQSIYPSERYADLFRRSNFYVIAYSFVPALVGLIGAAVVYVVFAGSILKGPMFPEFGCGKTPDCIVERCEAFHGFVRCWSPHGATEYAKAIVWAFVAGFSERFVPDVLNRLGSSEDRQ